MSPALHPLLFWERSCLSPCNAVSCRAFSEQRGTQDTTEKAVLLLFGSFLIFFFYYLHIFFSPSESNGLRGGKSGERSWFRLPGENQTEKFKIILIKATPKNSFWVTPRQFAGFQTNCFSFIFTFIAFD